MGHNSPATGPHTPADLSIAMAPVEAGTYKMMKHRAGRPFGQSLIALSFDGKTLTESSAAAEEDKDAPEKDAAVYDKQ